MLRLAQGAPWAVALAALWVYALTLSPTVAWVNQGEDSGDLLATSATLGIAHPTGYPLFVLLGRAACLLPLGSMAFRINLVAALAGAAGVYFLARLVLEVAPEGARTGAVLSAASAALLYAFSRGAWSQSVLAEVYTLNIAFLGAVLWALARAERTASARHLALAAFLLGLGLTNHLLMLAAAPAFLTTAWRLAANRTIGTGGLVLLPLLFLWGLSLDLYLPIRAAQVPEFSWGAPTSPQRLLWLLTGAQYERNFFGREAGVLVRYLVPGRWPAELGPALPVLGAGVAAALVARWRALLAPALTLAATLVLLSAYSIADDVGYWMPAVFAAAAMAGVGFGALWERFPSRGARVAVALIAAGAVVALPIAHGRSVDASRDLTPYVYAHRSLEAVEPNALIVSDYDGRTFSLWFYKATDYAGSRADLVVAYKSLLVWPWYRHHLARRYPTLAVPPYDGRLDEFMNRLIARNIHRRPVYLVREDPALVSVFQTEPVGDPRIPIYRVTLRPL